MYQRIASTSSSEIEIRWGPSETNGSPVNRYQVRMARVESDSTVGTYDLIYSDLGFVTTEPVLADTVYSLQFRAQNGIGFGECHAFVIGNPVFILLADFG